MAPDLTVHLVGGPTAILEYGGLRWMTDPAFDPPGDHGGLVKLAGPSVLTGPVIGFYLTGEAVPSLYVSGDNASVDVVRTIVDRLGPPELEVLFAGGARVPYRFHGAYLTLSSEDAAEAAHVLGSRAIVPVHFHGWQHFSNDGESLRAAFEAAGLSDRLVFAEPGETVSA
jgi:L-ascorbate metabolism protein UlaG (beta-lactamase superfamily)